MDPNAALNNWRECLLEGDKQGAKDARDDLVRWLNNGGFWPQGMTPIELGSLWRLYRLKPPEGYQGFSTH